MNMIKYYVGFFQNKNRCNPFARSIEWAEKTNYSHVEILAVADDNIDEAWCYGSVFPKSRSTPLSKMKEHYELKLIIPLTLKVSPEKADAILEQMMGEIYSFGQIFIIGFKILFHKSIGWLNTSKLNLSKFLICTEVAGLFMQEACSYDIGVSAETLTLGEVKEIALMGLLKDEA